MGPDGDARMLSRGSSTSLIRTGVADLRWPAELLDPVSNPSRTPVEPSPTRPNPVEPTAGRGKLPRSPVGAFVYPPKPPATHGHRRLLGVLARSGSVSGVFEQATAYSPGGRTRVVRDRLVATRYWLPAAMR